VHAEMLVACGGLLGAFHIERTVGENGLPLPIDVEAASPYLISIPIVHPVEFRVRSEERAKMIMGDWQDALAQQKAEKE